MFEPRRMLFALLALLPGPVLAQDFSEAEVVVTGTRRETDGFDESRPVVGLRRAADFAILDVTVAGDTRDQKTRRTEILAMVKSAIDLAALSALLLTGFKAVLSRYARQGDIVVVRSVDGRQFGLSVSDGSRVWNFDRTVPNLTLRGLSVSGREEKICAALLAICGIGRWLILAGFLVNAGAPPLTLLYVPADRPDRVAKALASGGIPESAAALYVHEIGAARVFQPDAAVADAAIVFLEQRFLGGVMQIDAAAARKAELHLAHRVLRPRQLPDEHLLAARRDRLPVDALGVEHFGVLREAGDHLIALGLEIAEALLEDSRRDQRLSKIRRSVPIGVEGGVGQRRLQLGR